MDWLGSDDCKWNNIAKRRLVDIVPPEELFAFLNANRGNIRAIAHMGAISITTETNVDAILRNNFRLSAALWTYCADQQIPLVYASSAGTYGDGRQGFMDRFDVDYLARLRPLNPYSWSKHLFDRWVLDGIESGARPPPRWAGLKFFNVYGPNEYHKRGQHSVAFQLHAAKPGFFGPSVRIMPMANNRAILYGSTRKCRALGARRPVGSVWSL